QLERRSVKQGDLARKRQSEAVTGCLVRLKREQQARNVGWIDTHPVVLDAHLRTGGSAYSDANRAVAFLFDRVDRVANQILERAAEQRGIAVDRDVLAAAFQPD